MTSIDATPKRYVGYIRVSTDFQADEGGSVADQLRRLQAHVEAVGGVWIGHYGDDDRSGGSLATRPDFRRLLEDLGADSFDAVIAESTDRFGRNLEDSLMACRTCKENGVSLHILDVGNGL